MSEFDSRDLDEVQGVGDEPEIGAALANPPVDANPADPDPAPDSDPAPDAIVERALHLANVSLRHRANAARELSALAHSAHQLRLAQQMVSARSDDPRAKDAERIIDGVLEMTQARPSGPTFIRRLEHALGADENLPIDPDLSPDDPGEPSPEHERSRVHRTRSHPLTLATIAAGGFIGTLGRYELSLAWPTLTGHFPAAIFVINTSGAFLIGFLLTLILERFNPPHHIRLFAVVGILGGWTTMSTFAVQADSLLKDNDPVMMAGYVTISLVAGIIAVALGMFLGRLGADRRLVEVSS